MAQRKRVWLGTMRFRIQSLAFLSGLRIQHCRELWRRSETWLRSGVSVAVAATAPIWPLNWEPPYVTGAALKKQKTKKEININPLGKWADHLTCNSKNLNEAASRIHFIWITIARHFFFPFFFSLAAPMAYGNFQARDRIQAAAAAYTTAVAMMDP